MAILKFADSSPEQRVDIAIVGAGISGLYCAWRLIQQDPTRTIAIVERLNRTGGRLNTDIVTIKPGEAVREEEGGMRVNFSMDELMNLLKALDLCKELVHFPMGSDNDTNRFALRGHSFTVADAKEGDNMIWSQIYNLDPKEVGLSPTDLVTNAYRNVLYANGEPYKAGQTPEFWTKFREEFVWKGKTMNQWQLWGLLRDMGYSEECIQMLTETIGFAGPFKSLANAGDAFQILADFPKDPAYYTFERGYSVLPDAIVADLTTRFAEQVQIYLSTNVDSIDRQDEEFLLKMTEAPHHQNASPFIKGGECKHLQAEKLIVAAATRGMEQLFITSPALNQHEEAEKLWANIHSALGMQLMKINLYFDSPWWEDGQTGRPPVQFGPNFSSLPLGAVYPFYSLPKKKYLLGREATTPEIRDAAAALTIYCDFDNTNFWHGLQNIGPMFCSELQSAQSNEQPQTLYPASVAVVEEARRQLAALFDVNWVPEPVLTSYRLWDGNDDFEFAYHQWRLNVVDSEVRAYLAAPSENLHFCNEAISDMQGWVNGSLRSSDLVLHHFGLEPMPSDPCQSAPKADPTIPARWHGLWGG